MEKTCVSFCDTFNALTVHCDIIFNRRKLTSFAKGGLIHEETKIGVSGKRHGRNPLY